MVKITYIEHDQTTTTVDVPIGYSVMEGAIANNIEGIVAACGGCCSCATCHCYIKTPWREKIDSIAEEEEDLLESVEDRTSDSRLSCQISVTEALDGLLVYLPPSQL